MGAARIGERELMALAAEIGWDTLDAFTDQWFEYSEKRMTAEIGRPVSFAMLQFDSRPDQWRELLEICARCNESGGSLFAQFAARPFGILS